MALIVEDGTIVAGANGYITLAELRAYWADRNVSFSQVDEVLEAAVVTATQHIDLNNNFKGEVTDRNQSLQWPRVGATDRNGYPISGDEMPIALKNATAEYAKRVTDGTALAPDTSADEGTIKRKRSKVDVIEKEVEYDEDSAGIVSFPAADNWLRGLTTSGGSLGNFGRIGCC